MADASWSISGALADFRMRTAVTSLASGVVKAAAYDESDYVDPAEPTYTGLLVAKQASVKAVLERYGAALDVPPTSGVDEAIATIEAWKAAHQSTWSKIVGKFLPTDSSVSSEDALAMPSSALRAYVEALYHSASESLHLYTSGGWQGLVDSGVFSPVFVRDDANARIQLFDAILALESSGVLAHAYDGVNKPLTRALAGLAGWGLAGPEVGAGVIILVVLSILALGAAVATLLVVKHNNDMAKAMCDRFLATGDPKYASGCQTKPDPVSEIAKHGLTVGAALLFGYVVITQLPAIKKALTS